MLQVAENTAGVQYAEDFSVQGALAVVHQMMNREAGDDSIERAELRQSLIHVMGDDLHTRVTGKTLSRLFEHRRREIQCHSLRLRMRSAHQCQQSAIPCTKVENTPRHRRHELEQRCLAFSAVANQVGAFQVTPDVLARTPKGYRAFRAHDRNNTETYTLN